MPTEYFIREQLSKTKESPVLQEAKTDFVEVQIAFSHSLFPSKEFFEFEYQYDEGYFENAVKDFYDDLDNAMNVTEEAISSGELNVDIIKLTATVDEEMLMGLLEMLRTDIAEYSKHDVRLKKKK
jgi:hypothetical protein